jgi:hypothetical protein
VTSDRHRSHHDLGLRRRQFQPETGIAVSQFHCQTGIAALSVPEFQTGNGPAFERTAGEPSQFSDRLRSNCHCLPVTVASGWPVLASARSESSALPATVLASEQQCSQAGAATVTVAVQCELPVAAAVAYQSTDPRQ